jgi:hypothetical protein
VKSHLLNFYQVENRYRKIATYKGYNFEIILDKALGHGAVLDQLLVNAEMSDELPEEMDKEVALPPMKNVVFGLDRDLIMSKVVPKTWLPWNINNLIF